MNSMNAVRPLVVVTLAATLAGCRGGAPEFTPAPGPSALVETVGSPKRAMALLDALDRLM